MHSYGIRGLALNLFTDYLKTRTESVKIVDHISLRLPVDNGVPQGTVLGPVLFLIYLNTLTDINCFEGKIVCFADDAALLKKPKRYKNMVNNSFLTLNIEKCKCCKANQINILIC
nr:unnamed protein product [Callosobruchus chinensis]